MVLRLFQGYAKRTSILGMMIALGGAILVGLASNMVGDVEPLSLLGIVGGLVFVLLALIRPLWGLWIIIACFLFSPANSPDPYFYVRPEEYFSVHTRFVFGLFSILEVMMLVVLLSILLRDFSWKRLSLRIWPVPNFVVLIIAMLVMGTVVGLFYLFFPHGGTTIRDMLITARPYLYLLAVYFLIARSIRSKTDLHSTLNLFLILLSIMALLGVHRFLPARSGLISVFTRRQMLNVIYGVGGPFAYFIAFYICSVAMKQMRGYVLLTSSLLAFTMAWEVFISSSRAGWLEVAGAVGLALLMAGVFRIISFRRILWISLVATIIFGLVVVAIGYSLPNGFERFKSALASFVNLSSSPDNINATRIVQVSNVILNLERDYALLWGLGLGTRWEEIVPQPPDWAAWTGEGQYPSGWHLVIHTPPLHILLRFGLLGVIGNILVFWWSAKRYGRFAARLENRYLQAQMLALTASFLVFYFWVHFLRPSGGIEAGIFLGLLEAGRNLWEVDPSKRNASH